ncbi:kinase-like domain-containing protein [Obelidium mucronatum]|nr:kinase-like domain-containing protein [Obelidium mucronatum]
MLSATGRTLGEGSYAVVKEAVIETGERFAAKVISKRLMAGKEDSILNEIDILKRVSKGHRNIVTLHDYFETPNNLYLVMDLCTGGELFDRIVERGSFYEEDAADIVKTILSATAYLHANHVVHRDIKPENILFRSKDSNELVLADFGLSKIANANESNLKTLVGTYGYIAPEILRQKGYTSSVDIWSIGVIAYFLLSGYTPFNGDNMLQDILDGRYAFQPYEYWVDISQLAQDFITRTVMLDPRKRMSAEDALEHPWILDYAPTQTVATLKRAMTKDLLPEVKSNMIGKDKLRSAVKTVMVSNRLASLTQQAKGNGSRDSGLSAATAVDEKGTVV